MDSQKHAEQLARDTAYQWQHAYDLLLANGWQPRKAGGTRSYVAEHPIHGPTSLWGAMPLV